VFTIDGKTATNESVNETFYTINTHNKLVAQLLKTLTANKQMLEVPVVDVIEAFNNFAASK